MSSSAQPDEGLHWWKKRASILARKTRARIAAALAKPGDAFLIVTEGTVTEPIYFDLLRRELKLSVVRIRVKPGIASDPRHVIETAARIAKEQSHKAKKGTLGNAEPPKYDHVWAIVDTDVAVSTNFWNEVEQLAAARKVTLGHSTPCFEFWLLLHLVGFTTRGDLVDAAAKSAVKHALGREYSTNRKTARAAIASFIGKWPTAVIDAERVRRHHTDAATPSPGNPSTEVDRLGRALNDSAPKHLRKL